MEIDTELFWNVQKRIPDRSSEPWTGPTWETEKRLSLLLILGSTHWEAWDSCHIPCLCSIDWLYGLVISVAEQGYRGQKTLGRDEPGGAIPSPFLHSLCRFHCASLPVMNRAGHENEEEVKRQRSSHPLTCKERGLIGKTSWYKWIFSLFSKAIRTYGCLWDIWFATICCDP